MGVFCVLENNFHVPPAFQSKIPNFHVVFCSFIMDLIQCSRQLLRSTSGLLMTCRKAVVSNSRIARPLATSPKSWEKGLRNPHNK